MLRGERRKFKDANHLGEAASSAVAKVSGGLPDLSLLKHQWEKTSEELCSPQGDR